jgi:hypothetical protein
MDAVRRGVDHLLPIRCIRIHVEVKSAGIGLVAQPPDAMSRVLIHPASRYWPVGVVWAMQARGWVARVNAVTERNLIAETLLQAGLK